MTQQIRVIDEMGEQLGILTKDEAENLAKSKNLDLICVNETGDHPVYKIMDYGKYKYQQEKKKQELKKKQQTVQLKEIKLRPTTDENDYQIKLKHVRRFISDGNKCKVTIFFKGREFTHKDLGVQVLERIINDLSEIAKTEYPIKEDGRNLHITLTQKR